MSTSVIKSVFHTLCAQETPEFNVFIVCILEI